jgi:5-methylcytosine-specific restriction protein A
MERAGNRCEHCGKPITGEHSIHHRLPRGMGGSKNPALNQPSNLVLLCGSATTPGGCHTHIEKFRRVAIATGWIVPRTADPARAPIKFPTGHWYLLADDGTLIPTLRPEELPEEDD